MKDRSDDPSPHERTLLPWNYITLLRKHRADTLVIISLVYYSLTALVYKTIVKVATGSTLIAVCSVSKTPAWVLQPVMDTKILTVKQQGICNLLDTAQDNILNIWLAVTAHAVVTAIATITNAIVIDAEFVSPMATIFFFMVIKYKPSL